MADGGPFVCASCGKGEDKVATFVVTTLDYEDPHTWRTEVCVPCWITENIIVPAENGQPDDIEAYDKRVLELVGTLANDEETG